VHFIALAVTLLWIMAAGVLPSLDPPIVSNGSQVSEFDLTDPMRPHVLVLQGSSYPKPFRDIDNAARQRIWGEKAFAH